MAGLRATRRMGWNQTLRRIAQDTAFEVKPIPRIVGAVLLRAKSCQHPFGVGVRVSEL